MKVTIKQHASIQAMQDWDKMQDVKQMTSAEVEKMLFSGAEPWEHVAMPEYVAQAIVDSDHFDRGLKDWAFMTLTD